MTSTNATQADAMLGEPVNGSRLRMRKPTLLSAIIGATFVVYIAANLKWSFPMVMELRWVLLGVLCGQTILLMALMKLAPPRSVLIPVSLYVAFLFINVLYSSQQLLSLTKATGMFALLLVTQLALPSVTRSTFSSSFMQRLGLTSVAVQGVTLLMLASDSAWDGWLLRGPFANSNGLGAFLALTLPGVYWLVSSRSESRGRLKHSPARPLARVLLVPGTLLLLLLTYSRAAMVAVAIASVVAFLPRRARYQASRIVFARAPAAVTSAAVFFLVASLAGLPLSPVRLLQKGDGPMMSSRTESLEQSAGAARQHLLVGSGYGTSADEQRVWAFGLQTGAYGREKTNSYLAVIEETGILGLVLLAAIIGPGLWGLLHWRPARAATGVNSSTPLSRPDPHAALMPYFLMLLVVGLVNANAESWLTSPGSLEGLIFWTALGLARSLRAIPDRNRVVAE